MSAAHVYIMASKRNGTLCIGLTTNLIQHIHQHRNGIISGFTKRYECKMLVWYQGFDDLETARHRELKMKEWRRAWKIELIEKGNPDWSDLWYEITK